MNVNKSEAISKLVQVIVEPLPANRIGVEEKQEPSSGIKMFVIEPMAEGAAPIKIRIGHPETFDIFFGATTKFEVMNSRPATISRVCKMVGAVGQGRFSEIIWRDGDRLIKSVGSFQINETRFKIVHRHTLFRNPFRKLQKTQAKYSPY